MCGPADEDLPGTRRFLASGAQPWGWQASSLRGTGSSRWALAGSPTLWGAHCGWEPCAAAFCRGPGGGEQSRVQGCWFLGVVQVSADLPSGSAHGMPPAEGGWAREGMLSCRLGRRGEGRLRETQARCAVKATHVCASELGQPCPVSR